MSLEKIQQNSVIFKKLSETCASTESTSMNQEIVGYCKKFVLNKKILWV